jgi:hypothetical protein
LKECNAGLPALTGGGVVFDMSIDSWSLPSAQGVVPVIRTFDWKTIGRLPKFYERIGRRGPDVRASTVVAEYELLARKADLEYNGIPLDQDGPVLGRLRSLPPVTPLAVGALGEFSREVDRFISDLGAKGSARPERFGCCHGAEQAKGVISNHASRCLGRVALRGVVRVRHTALRAVTAAPPIPYSGAHADAYGAGNAWDRSGSRAQSPFFFGR